MSGIKMIRVKRRAATELTQIENAIEAYKARFGFYPPGDDYIHPYLNIRMNSLYFELMGVSNTGNACVTLDGSATLQATIFSASPPFFGHNVGGILNCSRGSGGDEGGKAVPIIKTLTPDKFLTFYVTNGATAIATPFGVLGTSLEGPQMLPNSSFSPRINPWRYRNPGLSNINSFDLWVVVNSGSKWIRICNWSKTPLITTSPE